MADRWVLKICICQVVLASLWSALLFRSIGSKVDEPTRYFFEDKLSIDNLVWRGYLMPRKPHKSNEIEAVLRELEALGWTVTYVRGADMRGA